MAVSNGDLIRLVVSLVFPDDVVMQNVFHLVATNLLDTDEATVTQDAVNYANLLYNEHESSMSDEMSGDEIKVYVYDSVDDDFDEIGTGALSSVGSVALGPAPHGLAVVQNYYTTDPDVQGRKFWGGFTENSLDDSDWASALVAALVLTAAEVVGTYTDSSSSNVFQPSVWSPTKKTAYAYSGTVVTNTVPGYQRRRKPGVGI